MRSSCSVLLVLAGCNQVYGLEATRAHDAAYFDTPPDAPYRCPPIGTPPQFSRMFEQAVLQPCTSYTVSVSGRALAKCPLGGMSRIAEGPIGARLEIAPGFDELGVVYDAPRIGPDGKTAIVRAGSAFHVYTRDDVTWRRGAAITVTQGTLSFVSGPTRNGRIVAITSPGTVRELADDGNGNFTELRAQTFDALGLTSVGDQVHLTADGRRLVLRGSVGMGTKLLYSDREDIDRGFAKLVAMPNIDDIATGFMTEDCDRLYFSALGTVFETRPL